MGRDVEELDADGDDEMLERVAAIGVAEASGKVCVRVPGPKRRVTRVWNVASTTSAVMALADELVEMGVERVVVESTSDYWRPFFYLLEARGLRVWLVNARDVKQVPGRPKTDRLDAVWLAKLNERGMLRPSFVPPRDIRELRDYTRLRVELVRERSRHKQRVEKLLEDALIKTTPARRSGDGHAAASDRDVDAVGLPFLGGSCGWGGGAACPRRGVWHGRVLEWLPDGVGRCAITWCRRSTGVRRGWDR